MTTTILILMSACGLGIVLLAVIGRLNERHEDEDEPTIVIPPAEEPLGDQVDVRAILKRYGD